jgi:ATP-binding cassette subfamily C protein
MTAWSFCRTVLRITGWRFAEALVLMAGLGLTSGASVLLLIVLIHASGLEGVQPGNQTSPLFSWVIAVVGTPSLPVALGGFVLVTALQGWLAWRQARSVVALTQEVMLEMRQRLFTAICRTEWAVFSRYRSSDLVESLIEKIQRLGQATYALLTLCATVVTALVLAFLAVNISASMTALILATGALLCILLSGHRRRAAQVGEELSAADRFMFRAVTESLGSMKIVRSYGAEYAHIEELRRAGRALRDVHQGVAASPVAVKVAFDVGAAVILSLVAYTSIRGVGVAPAELFVLLVLFLRLAPQLSSIQVYYQALLADMAAFVSLQDTEAHLTASAAPAGDTGAVRDRVPFRHDIRLDRVTFSYGGPAVLSGVDLRIRAGGIVAIVGASGAGKTTAADLVMGLLVPQNGRVLVDGVELTRDRLEAWREQIGYVPQETFLFHDTVRNNLRWAAPHVTDRDLGMALSAAAAEDFVRRLPLGLDTVVGYRGVLLSGGERQRLALARALLRKPRLLILDEATSSLDSQNERIIQDATEGLRGDVAMLLIAHRLSSVRQADMIYVLEAGRVVETGDWDQLMARTGGRFRALCLAQGLDSPPAGVPSSSRPVAVM